MFNLGQLTRLPPYLAKNPFLPLLIKFGRVRFGSFEELFLVEKYLLRFSWLALLVMFGLVLPAFEYRWGLSTVVRLSTLVYPCFFLWSLTRLAGVELMQFLLEGQWTAELLALPLDNRAWLDGFVMPLWLVIRQYVLIVLFSLGLYTLETNTFIIDGDFYTEDYVRSAGSLALVFFNAALWIAFVYLARLYSEIRLRNGLLKGLATLFLLLGGAIIFVLYLLLFFRYSHQLTSNLVLGGQLVMLFGLIGSSVALHLKLLYHFRDYLASQIDLDLMIYDEGDPHTSGWTPIGAAPGLPTP